MTYQLTDEQADLAVDTMVNEFFANYEDKSSAYPLVTGQLRAILAWVLTGQNSPTLDAVIDRLGINKDLPQQ